MCALWKAVFFWVGGGRGVVMIDMIRYDSRGLTRTHACFCDIIDDMEVAGSFFKGSTGRTTSF